jgi:hypothetical protein
LRWRRNQHRRTSEVGSWFGVQVIMLSRAHRVAVGRFSSTFCLRMIRPEVITLRNVYPQWEEFSHGILTHTPCLKRPKALQRPGRLQRRGVQCFSKVYRHCDRCTCSKLSPSKSSCLHIDQYLEILTSKLSKYHNKCVHFMVRLSKPPRSSLSASRPLASSGGLILSHVAKLLRYFLVLFLE